MTENENAELFVQKIKITGWQRQSITEVGDFSQCSCPRQLCRLYKHHEIDPAFVSYNLVITGDNYKSSLGRAAWTND